MEKHNKILWYEGMTLDPHHFQQWDRFHQSSVHFQLRTLFPNAYGLTTLSIEEEGLANGLFKLTKCSGILPDGMVFNLPDESPLPSSRNFGEFFQATQDHLGVFLALPSEKPGGQNALLNQADGQINARYMLEEVSIVDDNTGTDHRQIGVARPNFQIRFENESLEDFAVIKLAEITRTAESDFTLNQEFIPPCLHIGSSSNLGAIVRRLLEFLVARTNALRNNRKFTSDGRSDIALKEFPVYGQLSALSTCVPVLNQYFTSSRVHPQQLHALLLQLGGQLSVYSPETSLTPTSFPGYDHTNLSQVFLTLERQIRQLLGEIVMEKNYHRIPLDKRSENMYTGQIAPETLFEEANFYLSCMGDVPEAKMVHEFPDKLRVASPDMMTEVLSTATRALSISHQTGAPQGIPDQEGKYYYRLEKKGPFWSAIVQSQAVSIYLPAEFQKLELEFLAVKER